MVTPLISLDKSLNGYLNITDITVYTTGQRDLYGIMMFWSTDAFVADFNTDQSNSTSWNLPVTSQDTYNVYSFYCYAWDVLNNVNLVQGDIVLWNGYFYVLIGNTTLNPSTGFINSPAVDTANWAALVVGKTFTFAGGATYTNITAKDIYDLAVASTGGQSPNAVATTSITYIDNPSFVLTKTDCLKWSITVNLNCTIARVRLLNYDGTLLLQQDSPVSTPIVIDLTPWGDGSYQVEIAYVISIGNLQVPLNWIFVYIPILEVCQANACYVKLFKYTLCKCDDPCDDCDELKSRLHDMRMIRELVTTINQMVNLDRSQFIGIYPISTTQADLLTDIGQMIDKLKLITDRCGLCGCDNNEIDCS